MRNCDTLIIGSGHAAMGIATACQDVLICEESEFCDGGFSLTLKQFARDGYRPQTEAGKELLACYESLGLISDTLQNCSALEIGLSRFALQRNVPILLKCRVVRVEQTEDGYAALLLTNAGLERVRAKRVVDTRGKGKKRLTVQFTLQDAESLDRVRSLFPEGEVERDFYPDRGVLHLPAEGDYNQALCCLYDRWAEGEPEKKILLIAPRLETVAEEGAEAPTDSAYRDPIAAFEAGYLWGKGAV